ncbi:hypothetical protein JHN59_18825 [Streptomyces sp. MBT49]|nr:hypothetical protein [Streptomyces sp. MBT49]
MNHSSRRLGGCPETSVTVQHLHPLGDTSIPQNETKEEDMPLLTRRRFLDFGRCAGDGCRG